MKSIKIILASIIVLTFSLNTAKAEAKTDCSQISADTGVALYKKLRCKMGQPVTEEGKLGKKIKNFLKKPFQKKSVN
tara:strand:+ start:5378 stop:5608 length:231 start_codon:yes stop_codon:yes gene_type:complete